MALSSSTLCVPLAIDYLISDWNIKPIKKRVSKYSGYHIKGCFSLHFDVNLFFMYSRKTIVNLLYSRKTIQQYDLGELIDAHLPFIKDVPRLHLHLCMLSIFVLFLLFFPKLFVGVKSPPIQIHHIHSFLNLSNCKPVRWRMFCQTR